ncbi:MAG TPA: Hsp20/alpha crystallin family protein [candidate division Zixibacteria bacterium]|nr:Hsp20/alpha crystallin family protein [candidate division Zixibacteria bacterium]
MTYLVNPSRISKEVDQMFNRMFTRNNVVDCDDCADFVPRVNIKETKDNVVLTFELPGMDKKDINVTVEHKLLTVHGERKFESAENENGIVRNEIVTGSFSRSFTLPDYVDTENVAADYKNGLLTVQLSRKEETKPKQIDVKVS